MKVKHWVTKDGPVVGGENAIGKFMVKSDTFPSHLPACAEFFDIKKKIPLHIIERAIKFFESVERKYGSEGFLILTMDTTDGKYIWGLHVPNQIVSAAGVKWFNDDDRRDANAHILGTFHSHPSTPFISRKDKKTATENDEASDGLYLCYGLGNKEITAHLAIHGNILEVSPDDVIDGWGDEKDAASDDEWLEFVTKKPLLVKIDHQLSPDWWNRYHGENQRKLEMKPDHDALEKEADRILDEGDFGEVAGNDADDPIEVLIDESEKVLREVIDKEFESMPTEEAKTELVCRLDGIAEDYVQLYGELEEITE